MTDSDHVSEADNINAYLVLGQINRGAMSRSNRCQMIAMDSAIMPMTDGVNLL